MSSAETLQRLKSMSDQARARWAVYSPIIGDAIGRDRPGCTEVRSVRIDLHYSVSVQPGEDPSAITLRYADDTSATFLARTVTLVSHADADGWVHRTSLLALGVTLPRLLASLAHLERTGKAECCSDRMMWRPRE